MSELNFSTKSSSDNRLCISTFKGFADLIILFRWDHTNEPTKKKIKESFSLVTITNQSDLVQRKYKSI